MTNIEEGNCEKKITVSADRKLKGEEKVLKCFVERVGSAGKSVE